MRRRTVAGLVAARLAAIALVVGVSVVWPGLDAQRDADGRRLRVGAADRRRPPLRAGEHRRSASSTPCAASRNPDEVVEIGDGAYLFSDSFSKVTRDRRGAAGGPRRGGAARVADHPRRHRRGRRRPATSSPTAPTPARCSRSCLGGGRRAARSVPVRRRGRAAVHRRCDRRRRARHRCSATRGPTGRCCATTSATRASAGATRSRPTASTPRRSPPPATPGRSSTPTTASWLRGADAAVAGADHGRGRRRRARRRRDGGLPRRRERPRAAAGRRLGGRRRIVGRRTARARHARAADRPRGRGLRGVARAGRRRRHAVEPRDRRSSRSTTAASSLGDQRRPVVRRERRRRHPERDALGLGVDRAGRRARRPRARTGRWMTAPTRIAAERGAAAVVIDPKPPVAEPDAFGVRAGELVDPAGAHERPRSERGRAEHRPDLGDGARPGLRHACRSPTTGSASRCASRPARRGTATLQLRRHRRHARGRAALRADDRHPDGRRRRGERGARVVRRAGLPRRVAEAGGRAAAARSRCPCCRAGSIPTATRCCCSSS